MRSVAALACVSLALAACGEDDEAAAPAAPPAGLLADLEVTYDRDGQGGREPIRARVRCSGPGDSATCRAVAGLTAQDFAPTPDKVACTLQYGGPRTASVTGTLRGEEIDAEFSREDGCAINRWEGVAPLIESVP